MLSHRHLRWLGKVYKMEFKLTIADPKTGKCTQKAVSDAAAQAFIGTKIGEKFNGESIDAQGYEL